MLVEIERNTTKRRFEGKSTSQIAAAIFAEASIQCPASVTAQAAYIARECKYVGNNPMDLYTAISDDDRQLKKLSKAANAAHMARDRWDIPQVDEGDARAILLSDFKRAQEYMILDNGQLTAICTTLYKTNIIPGLGEEEGEKREKRLHATAQHWLYSRRPRTGNFLTKIFDSATISDLTIQTHLWAKQ